MTYSIIQKSQLEGAKRLDAEYYQPEFLELKRNLKRFRSKSLMEVAQVTGGKRLPLGETFSEVGIPYLRVVDIYETFIDLENIKYISEKLHLILKRYLIQKKDILITIVGNTVGLIGYDQHNLKQFNFTENCARIRAKDVLPEYLLSILLSKVGQLQVDRERVGTAQPKLSLDRLRNFCIPCANHAFQSKIKDLVEKSLQSYSDAKSFYSQAENLLLEELGLTDFKDKDDKLFNIVNLSEVKKASRVDAEFFQVKYEELIKKIKVKNIKTLGNLVSMKKGIEPGSEKYEEEGAPFIRVSNLSKFGVNENNQKYLEDEFYQKLKKDYQPQVDEILLTKDATPGLAWMIKEEVKSIISGGILRLKLEYNIEPEYLALVLNSIVGQMQAERDTGGSIIVHWRPEQIKNILIPILPQSTQRKIANLVRESHQARKKAKELLDEAKRKVEKMIEEGNN